MLKATCKCVSAGRTRLNELRRYLLYIPLLNPEAKPKLSKPRFLLPYEGVFGDSGIGVVIYIYQVPY